MGAEYATPHIDQLALGGVRLNQSYVHMVCSLSRASLLSSRYAYSVGMDGDVLRQGDERCLSVTTVGHQMHRNDVRTAYIGKYDVGYSSWSCTPNCNGFEYFLGLYGPPAQDCTPAPAPTHGSGLSTSVRWDFVSATLTQGFND